MQPYTTEKDIALVTWEHVVNKNVIKSYLMQPYTRQQNIGLVTWEHVLNKQRYQILLNATIHMRTKHCSGYLGARSKQTALSKSYLMQPYTREINIALVTWEHVLNKQRYKILLNATIN